MSDRLRRKMSASIAERFIRGETLEVGVATGGSDGGGTAGQMTLIPLTMEETE
jgi:hypothetical protein